ncbi:MAG: IPT/TIG domain-containing protein [Planctomycetes bacterium]|nr:IPT/TIG domain-containing protein [Planctomycetota bacterium]
MNKFSILAMILTLSALALAACGGGTGTSEAPNKVTVVQPADATYFEMAGEILVPAGSSLRRAESKLTTPLASLGSRALKAVDGTDLSSFVTSTDSSAFAIRVTFTDTGKKFESALDTEGFSLAGFLDQTDLDSPMVFFVLDAASGQETTSFELPGLCFQKVPNWVFNVYFHGNGRDTLVCAPVEEDGDASTLAPRLVYTTRIPDFSGNGTENDIMRLDFHDGLSFYDVDLDGAFGERADDKYDINGSGSIDSGDRAYVIDVSLDGVEETRAFTNPIIGAEDYVGLVDFILSPDELVLYEEIWAEAIVKVEADKGCPMDAKVILTLDGGLFEKNQAAQLVVRASPELPGFFVDFCGNVYFRERFYLDASLSPVELKLTSSIRTTDETLTHSESIPVAGPTLPVVTGIDFEGDAGGPQPGDLVTINGANFGFGEKPTFVRFGGVPAEVVEVRGDQIVVRVPEGGISGPVEVTVGGVTSGGSVEATIQPKVAFVLPAPDSAGVSVNTKIVVSFDREGAELTTASLSVRRVGGSAIGGTIAKAVDGRSFIFTPTTPLSPAEDYEIRVPSRNWSSLFTTIDAEIAEDFTAAGFVPANAEINVEWNAPVKVTFTAPVDPSTVNPENFALTAPGLTVQADFAVLTNATEVVITPKKTVIASSGYEFPGLAAGANFTLTLAAGIRSLAGTSLSNPGATGFMVRPGLAKIVPDVARPGTVVDVLGGPFGNDLSNIEVLVGGKAAQVTLVEPHMVRFRAPETPAAGLDVRISGVPFSVPGFRVAMQGEIIGVGELHQRGAREAIAGRDGRVTWFISREGRGVSRVDFDTTVNPILTLPLPGLADDLVLSPVDSTVLVLAHQLDGRGQLFRLDETTMFLSRTFSAPARPVAMARSAAGTDVYVIGSEPGDFSKGELVSIDPTTGSSIFIADFDERPLDVVCLGREGSPIAVLFEKSLRVVDDLGNELLYKNLEHRTYISVPDNPQTGVNELVTENSAPHKLIASRDREKLFVLSTDGILETFSADFLEKIGHLELSGNHPSNIAISPADGTLFVAFPELNFVEAVNPSATGNRWVMPTGVTPTGVAVQSNGANIFVTLFEPGVCEIHYLGSTPPTVTGAANQTNSQWSTSADPGKPVTITGSGFSLGGTNTVLVGGQPVQVTGVTATSITFNIPESFPPGPVDLQVVSDGVASPSISFEVTPKSPWVVDFYPRPDDTNVLPNEEVWIRFSEPMVTPNSVKVPVRANGNVVDGTYTLTEGGRKLTFTPRDYQALGASVVLTITTAYSDLYQNAVDANPNQQGVQNFTLRYTITEDDYIPPYITDVVPGVAPSSGGSNVRIVGLRFQDGSRAYVGGVSAIETTFLSANELEVTVPPGITGPAVVRVEKPNGLIHQTATMFRYLPPGATLGFARVTPDFGPAQGGAVVEIQGFGFKSGINVLFDDTPAISVSVSSTELLVVEVPPGQDDTTVNLTFTLGAEVLTASDKFTYIGAPQVALVEPSEGPTAGGNTITIRGDRFRTGVAVTIGGLALLNVTRVNMTEIVGTVPSGLPSVSDIVVTNIDGQSVTLESAYALIPPPIVSSIVPTKVLPGGSSLVRIVGENFQPGVVVYVGGVQAEVIVHESETSLIVRVPSGPEGFAEVIVRNPDDQMEILPDAVEYTQDVPSVEILDAQLFDDNQNGKIDRVALTFSRPVLDSSLTLAGFTLLGKSPASIITGSAADDSFFDLQFADEVPGTGLMDLLYQSAAGLLTDSSGGFLPDVAASDLTESDKAAPVLYGEAIFTDVNGNNLLDAGDTILAIVSESVVGSSSGDAAIFAFADSLDALGDEAIVISATEPSYADIAIDVTTFTITLGTSPTLNITGQFDGAGADPHGPSGIRFATVSGADVLADISGNVPAGTEPPIDVAANIEESGMAPLNADSIDSAFFKVIDVNEDGMVDIVKGVKGAPVTLMLGAPDGTFLTELSIPTSAQFAMDVAAGDVDKDGNLDFVVAGYGESNEIFLGDGAGGFTAGTLPADGDFTRAIFLEDIDCDGNLDVLTANYRAGVRLYTGDGAGSFTLANTFEGATQPKIMCMEVADFNGDGKHDFVLGCGGSDQNVLSFGDGAGGFTAGALPGAMASTYAICSGDLDSDGDVDFVSGTTNAPDKVYINQGGGSFAVLDLGGASISTTANALADLDRDGDLDYVAKAGTEVHIFLNDGRGAFTEKN